MDIWESCLWPTVILTAELLNSYDQPGPRVSHSKIMKANKICFCPGGSLKLPNRKWNRHPSMILPLRNTIVHILLYVCPDAIVIIVNFTGVLIVCWLCSKSFVIHSFFFFFFFLFFFFICSEFCHTLKWKGLGFTCLPHPDPTSLSFTLSIFLFIFLLCCVFVTVHGLFWSCSKWGLLSSRGMWASHCSSLRSRGARVHSSVQFQFSHSVLSDSLWPHELQHTRPPCPSPTPGVDSNSCPLCWWCHPAISSSVVPFSSCL